MLTITLFVFGSPLGLSTQFGLSDGMIWSGSLRVWFHFLINLAATVPAVLALAALQRRSPSTSACPAVVQPHHAGSGRSHPEGS